MIDVLKILHIPSNLIFGRKQFLFLYVDASFIVIKFKVSNIFYIKHTNNTILLTELSLRRRLKAHNKRIGCIIYK